MGGPLQVTMQRPHVGKLSDTPAEPRLGFRQRARRQFSNFIHSKSPKRELVDSSPSQAVVVDSENLSNGFSPATVDYEKGSGRRSQELAVDFHSSKQDSFGSTEAWPEEFLCPISKLLMADPVLVASGTTYERRNIEVYLKLGYRECFKTRETLEHQFLTKNSALKQLIDNWCDTNGVPRPMVPDAEAARDAVEQACRADSPSTSESVVVTDVPSSSSTDSSGGGSRRSGIEPFPAKPQGIPDSASSTVSATSNDLARLESHHNRERLLEARHHTWSGDNVHRKFTPKEYPARTDSFDLVEAIDERTWASPASPRKYAHSSSVPNVHQQGRGGVPLPLTTTPSAFSESSLQNDGSGAVQGDIDQSVMSSLIQKMLHKHALEQEQAVVEIRQLTRSSQNRLALCQPEFLDVLLPLLHSRYANVQINAIAAVMNVSLEKENKLKVARAGAIPTLIDVLKSGHPEAQEHAAGAIFSLALNDENKMAIGVLGAIPPLIHVLRIGKHGARRDAAMALYHLSFSQMNKSKLIKAGAVGILLGIARDERTDVVSRALLILCNIAAIPEGRGALIEMSAVQVMVGLLARVSEEGAEVDQDDEQARIINWADVREHAAAALLQLSHHNFRFKSQALQAGALEGLLRLAEEGTPRAREKANALITILRDAPSDVSYEDTGAVYRRSYNRNRAAIVDEKAESAQF